MDLEKQQANDFAIAEIIRHAQRSNIDISPSDHKEWALWGYALHALGYTEQDFLTLSWGNERTNRETWRGIIRNRKGMDIETAQKKVLHFAKQALGDIKPFYSLSDERPRKQGAPRATPPTPTPPRQKPEPFYIPIDIVRKQREKAEQTTLFAYLATLFAPEQINQAFDDYLIGGSKFVNSQGLRAVSFPYIDIKGFCIDAKIMQYNPTSGKRKEAEPIRPQGGSTMTWGLFEMGKSERRGDWCAFGTHLARIYPTKPIAVVESEKTAVICSMVYPHAVWVAVGSKANLDRKRLDPFIGRQITLYPDRDGAEEWRAKAKELTKEGFNIAIDTTLDRHPGENNDDIADIVLRCIKGEQSAEPPQETRPPHPMQKAWEKLKEQFPWLRELETRLELELI